jgi:glutathione S-transferase
MRYPLFTVNLSDDPELVVPVLWQLEVSHYNEKVRWALDYKHVPHIRRSLLPGLHALKAKRLTGDTSTTPVLTLDGRPIGDSTRIIAAIEECWPHPPPYPPDAVQLHRALELEEFFDEELGPHIRRLAYQELLPHPRQLAPLFAHGQPLAARVLLRAGFPLLRTGVRRRFDITAEVAERSRAKTGAAMDRLEREISPGGFLVGESFTVADRTAAALFYAVVFPPEFPYPTIVDLPPSLREFLGSLAQRPGGNWVAEISHRHRGSSAEPTPGRSCEITPDSATPDPPP